MVDYDQVRREGGRGYHYLFSGRIFMIFVRSCKVMVLVDFNRVWDVKLLMVKVNLFLMTFG